MLKLRRASQLSPIHGRSTGRMAAIFRMFSRKRSQPSLEIEETATAASPTASADSAQLEPPREKPLTDELREAYTTRKRFILTDLISELDNTVRFKILDGGAREALNDPRWSVLPTGSAQLYGFEVDAEECAALNKEAAERGLDYRYFPIGLWREKARLSLEENKAPGGSSFFPQNVEITNRWKFQNAKDAFLARDIFYPVGTSEWDLTSVDAWAAENDINDIDFMKLNVQGSELEILEGSKSLLNGVTGILTEVSFVESYKNRPFFSDIDVFLRSQGFTFFEFIGHHHIGRATSPITATHTPGLYPQYGQMIECHALYFRDPLATRNRVMATDKALKLVCFAEIFAQTEFAFEILSYLIERADQDQQADEASKLKEIMERALTLYRSVLGAT